MQVLTVDYNAKDAPELFVESLRNTGFAVLDYHPISTGLIRDCYQGWKEFFSSDNKMNYVYQKPSQQGYIPYGTESAKDQTISDLKECYHFYLNGKVPPDLADITTRMYTQLNDMAAILLQWIESQLPKKVLQQLTEPLQNMIKSSPNTMLRILHYPPMQTEIPAGAVRAAAHEDINLITLLPAATTPGLEVQDTQGRWHAVNCDPGNVAVNVADMLQLATQGYLKSTTHRVVNPTDTSQKNTSRYSMPLFLHPRPEVRLSPDRTASEYLAERLREIGIY
jgi:isopenicillin N synthase-like dioxygenase